DSDFLYWSVVLFLYGLSPLFISFTKEEFKKKALLVWCSVSTTLVFIYFVQPTIHIIYAAYLSDKSYVGRAALVIFGSIIFSLLLYIGFIGIVRISLRNISTSESFVKIILHSLMNTAPVICLLILGCIVWVTLDYSTLDPNVDYKIEANAILAL